jgi:hypothetical protein
MKYKIKEVIKQLICSQSPSFSCPQHHEISTAIPEITPIEIICDNADIRRINLLIPSVNKAHVFGGISTAITFFNQLLDVLPKNYHARVIVTDASAENRINSFEKYRYSKIGEKNNAKYQVIIANDRSNKKLPVVKHDIFIASAWWTAYILKDVIKEQKNCFANVAPLIYFIQDFEPCFYSWSARYALADSTYRQAHKTIAIFNSKELFEYMQNRPYHFYKKYYFLPKMNEKLKEYWKIDSNLIKKKQLIIYGRPSVERNLFPIIIEALKIWVSNKKDLAEWTLLSLGEKHEDIELGNNAKLISKGKVTLEEYAHILMESSLGVSLMLSPHPSYPPLEMAYFGILTVTNHYENKNLEKMHSNIMSVKECDPYMVAQKIEEASLLIEKDIQIGLKGQIKDETYISEKEQFDFLEDISKELLF